MNNSHGTVPSRSGNRSPPPSPFPTDQRRRVIVPQPSGGARHDSFLRLVPVPLRFIGKEGSNEKRRLRTITSPNERAAPFSKALAMASKRKTRAWNPKIKTAASLALACRVPFSLFLVGVKRRRCVDEWAGVPGHVTGIRPRRGVQSSSRGQQAPRRRSQHFAVPPGDSATTLHASVFSLFWPSLSFILLPA